MYATQLLLQGLAFGTLLLVLQEHNQAVTRSARWLGRRLQSLRRWTWAPDQGFYVGGYAVSSAPEGPPMVFAIVSPGAQGRIVTELPAVPPLELLVLRERFDAEFPVPKPLELLP